MSYSGERGFAVRVLAALAGVVLAGAVAWPAAAQDAPDSRDARGSIRQMQRLSAEEGWVLTDSALLFTSDGGASWSEMTSGQGLEGVTDAYSLSASQAWLAGVDPGSLNRLVVLETADGGATWREQVVEASALDSGQVYAGAQVRFLDVKHGWLLGEVATSAAFSVGELLRTTDGGVTWQRLPRPPVAGRFVFIDAQRGFMTGAPMSERLYRTLNGGRTWEEVSLPVSAAAGMALYDLPTFRSPNRGTVAVTLRGESPRLLTFVTRDGGRRWLPGASVALPAGDYDEPVPAALSAGGMALAFAAQGSVTFATDAKPRGLSLARQDRVEPEPAGASAVSVSSLSYSEDASGWVLAGEGACEEGVCRQVSRLVAVDGSGEAVDLLVRTEEEVQLALEAEPASSGAFISFGKGFGPCAAPTTTEMQTWMNYSPYRDLTIYYGGVHRGCREDNERILTPSWVSTVMAQGWRLIPAWVGLQAPCFDLGRDWQRISKDSTTARNQAVAEADAAVNAAAALGLGPGTPLYYDLERYPQYDTEECAGSAGVRAFVNAWTERVKYRGYLAGVYGYAGNAQSDWRPGVIANPPDAVWLTPWVCDRGVSSCPWTPTVFGIPGVDDAYWANNQRIRQYWGDHTETFAGVKITGDSEYANGPVAGVPPSWCQTTVPAGDWKGEYFDNMSLSGDPVRVRSDGNGSLNWDWRDGSPSEGCGVPPDLFSVRWTRTAYFTAGAYEFNVTSDDGFRLWVDGVLELDEWFDQGPTLYTKLIALSDGYHDIRMEYYENRGGAVAKLSWELVPDCFTNVPPGSWKGEYFLNKELSGSPAMIRDDGTGFLDFSWSYGSPSPPCGFPSDNFSVRWTRTAYFNAGAYEFNVTSDDGFRLWVDGVLQMEAWVDQGATHYTKLIALSGGDHDIRMEYYENGGEAVAKLSWEFLSNCFTNVPWGSWKGEYFLGKTLSGTPAMIRNDGTGFLNFSWYNDSPSPPCGFPADNFSVRWTRSVHFSAGTYQFNITSDDGFRVYVDGVLQREAWVNQGPTYYSFNLPLSDDDHTITMEYYENTGWAVAKLSWKTMATAGTFWGFDVTHGESPLPENGRDLTNIERYFRPDGPCYNKAPATCRLDTRMVFINGGHRIESITTPDGRFWHFDLDAPGYPGWSNNGGDNTEVERYMRSNGPCYRKAFGTCRFDTRMVFINGGHRIESITTANGKLYNFDIDAPGYPGWSNNGGDNTQVERYMRSSGPCYGKAAGTCRFDTRTVFIIGGHRIESITTPNGKFWHFDIDAPGYPGWSNNGSDNTQIARYMTPDGPCQGKAAGTCRFDTRVVYEDASGSLIESMTK